VAKQLGACRRARVLKRDDYTCFWCAEKFLEGNLDVHHHVRTSMGGPDDDWNLVTVCRHHHLRLNVCAWDDLPEHVQVAYAAAVVRCEDVLA
jgi:5-methylcytosine-specific restriction endonuclease McrA